MENETCEMCGEKVAVVGHWLGPIHSHEPNDTACLRNQLTALTAQLAPYKAVEKAAGEAVRLCGLEGSLDRLDAALAAIPGGEG